MTWRDDLRRVTLPDGRKLIGASFRGVPFFVEESERSGGRRAVIHKFPYRDDPYAEDLGREQRDFNVQGYVLGDDYLAARDALLDALETEGPGELIHPYHGTRIVIAPKFSQSEAKGEGGIAKFSIEFIETPLQAPVPTVSADAIGQVGAAADAADAATDAELAATFSAAGMPAFSLASAQTALSSAASALKAKLGPIVTSTQELAQLNSAVGIMLAQSASLVTSPGVAIGQFRALASSLVDTAANAPGAMMAALFDAYGADLGAAVAATTATRARELANQNALVGALRRAIAVLAARLAPTVPYVTIDDALLARDTVTSMLDEQAGTAGDAAYPALVDLRAQVLRAVPGSATFARIVTVTRKTSIPSLLLAYQLYGSVELEGDIIARNGIQNPAFIAGDLKVLSDG